MIDVSETNKETVQARQTAGEPVTDSIRLHISCAMCAPSPCDRFFLWGLLFKYASLWFTSWELSLDETVSLRVPSQSDAVLFSTIFLEQKLH